MRLKVEGLCRTPYHGAVGFSLRSMEVVQLNRNCLLVVVNEGNGGGGLGRGPTGAWAKINKILPKVFNTKYAPQISGELNKCELSGARKWPKAGFQR